MVGPSWSSLARAFQPATSTKFPSVCFCKKRNVANIFLPEVASLPASGRSHSVNGSCTQALFSSNPSTSFYSTTSSDKPQAGCRGKHCCEPAAGFWEVAVPLTGLGSVTLAAYSSCLRPVTHLRGVNMPTTNPAGTLPAFARSAASISYAVSVTCLIEVSQESSRTL